MISKAEYRWLIILVSVFLGSSAALVWLTRPRACIDSGWIQQLEIDTVQIFSCQLRRHVPFSEWTHENLNEINQRVRKVERALESLEVAERPLGTFKVTMSSFAQGQSFERGVLGRALFGTAMNPERELFVSLITGIWFQTFEESPNLDRQVWSTLVQNEFKSLGISDRKRFLREWLGQLSREDSPLTGSYSKWTWSVWLKQKSFRLGYDFSNKTWNINSLILSDQPLDPDTETQLRIHRIANVVERSFQLPFSARRYSQADLGPFRVGKLVLVRCQFPDLNELSLLGFEFEHIVLVRTCEPPSANMLLSAIKNTNDFALDYPEAQYVHIHWPSLKMVLNRSGVKARTIANLFDPNSLKSFSKIGFLKELKLDHTTRVGKWAGALEPLVSYRIF